jgi:hypothetical protein
MAEFKARRFELIRSNTQSFFETTDRLCSDMELYLHIVIRPAGSTAGVIEQPEEKKEIGES